MDRDALEKLLKSVADGTVSPAEAEHLLRKAPYEDIGYAKIDLHRGIREGAAEVIYGAGKTAEQIAGIIKAMYGEGEKSILITRLDADKKAKTEEILGGSVPLHYYTDARIAIAGSIPEKTSKGTILVATGGTSDQPVAEEAAITAEFLGNHVMRLYDVGVSGLHRLLSHIDDILDARVIVVAAGMEERLPAWSAGSQTARSLRCRLRSDMGRPWGDFRHFFPCSIPAQAASASSISTMVLAPDTRRL